MNQYVEYDGDVMYRRVSKARARRAWDAGMALVLCPCRLRPFGAARASVLLCKAHMNGREFGVMVRDFTEENCNARETGRYPSYFLRVEP